MNSKDRRLVAGAFLGMLSGALGAVLPACNKGDGGVICQNENCPTGVDEYRCRCGIEDPVPFTNSDYPGYLCDSENEGLPAMEAECDLEVYCTEMDYYVSAQFLPCVEVSPGDSSTGEELTTGTSTTTPTTSGGEFPLCGDWSPESDVQLFQGVYYLDGGYLSSLVNNPELLLTCDDARLDPLLAGGYQVVNADDGELLYELGLRNGDIPLELNDLPLDSADDAFAAFAALYGQASFELDVLRGTTPITLEYFVTYTF